jgi:hypothetical protein
MQNENSDMKKIVIYGAGFEAERFITYSQGAYEPEYYIDRNANRTFHGKKVYTYEEKKNELNNKKILVAANEHSYKEISILLENEGFVEFEDFLSIHYLGKQLVILYGNCHMMILKQYFEQQVEFVKKYFVRLYYVGNKEIPSENDIKHCSIFIGQDIAEINEMNVQGVGFVIDKLPQNCLHIVIPNLYGYKFFWPQVKERFDNIDNLHIGNDRIPENDLSNLSWCSRGPVRWMIGWRDSYIEKCLEDGMSIDDIIFNCEYKDVFKEKEIKKCFYDSLNKLKLREQECDITISDYIEQNYQKEELFYDPGHPTNTLLKEIARILLEKIGIKEIEFLDNSYRLDSMEIFIYGCVKKALELQYDKKFMKNYERRGTLGGYPITVEEYIKQYKLWYEN